MKKQSSGGAELRTLSLGRALHVLAPAIAACQIELTCRLTECRACDCHNRWAESKTLAKWQVLVQIRLPTEVRALAWAIARRAIPAASQS